MPDAKNTVVDDAMMTTNKLNWVQTHSMLIDRHGLIKQVAPIPNYNGKKSQQKKTCIHVQAFCGQ